MDSELKSYKTTSLLHAKYIEDSRKLTTTQKRSLLYIYSKIYEQLNKDGEKDWYTLEIDDLFHELQAHKGGNQTVLIWDYLAQLVETKVEIEYENENGSIEKRVRITGLISEIDRPIAVKGEFKVKISDIIAKNIQYKQGHIYRWILMRYAMKLSGHALDIYEMLKAVENIPKWFISLDDLKARTHCQNKYPKFAHFEERVLVPAQKEISSETDLSFRYNVERGKRRKVLGITFYIKNNSKNKSKEVLISKSNTSLKSNLESKGVLNPQQFNIPDYVWEKALLEEPDSPPANIITTAKRIFKEENIKYSKPDYSKQNKEYWEEHKDEYTGLMDSTAYIQDNSGNTITWSDGKFIDRLKPYLKAVEDDSDDKRGKNLYVETFKSMTASGAQQKIINRINVKKQEGIYTDWDRASNRVNGTNPEKVGAYFVGRASKENQEELKQIYNEVYGKDWEEKAKERLAKKGMTF